MGANLEMCHGLGGRVPSGWDVDLFEIYTRYETAQAFFNFKMIFVKLNSDFRNKIDESDFWAEARLKVLPGTAVMSRSGLAVLAVI
ncbi:hypothetical protein [Curvibacter gracilis]|uniref:hypothetical protein n=1 Tax=Curvibacter gracilis TaxID=230310 RepID=UPI00146FAF5F|nr:hypothetical protein [Curvibacter gracilis]